MRTRERRATKGAPVSTTRWPRRLNLVLFLGVVLGSVWLIGEVRLLGRRVEVRAEFLDQASTVGIGQQVFREHASGDTAPWRLGVRAALQLRAGEEWKSAIERTYPAAEVVSVRRIPARFPARGDRVEAEQGSADKGYADKDDADKDDADKDDAEESAVDLATVILQVEGAPPRGYLAVAVGSASARTAEGLPALLLASADPPTHEYAVRGVSLTDVPRNWFEILVGRPSRQCIVSTYRGERTIEDALRFADGPPWGREILERAFSTER